MLSRGGGGGWGRGRVFRDIPFIDVARAGRGVANEAKFLYPKKSYLAETEPKESPTAENIPLKGRFHLHKKRKTFLST